MQGGVLRVRGVIVVGLGERFGAGRGEFEALHRP